MHADDLEVGVVHVPRNDLDVRNTDHAIDEILLGRFRLPPSKHAPT
jgi:hypothetical protein